MQTASAQAPALLLGLDSLRQQFIGIPSIDITGIYTTYSYDPSRRIFATVKVHIREQGDQYLFETEDIGEKKWPTNQCIVAYDGTTGQYFDKGNNELFVKKNYQQDFTTDSVFFNPLAQLVPFFPFERRSKEQGHLTRLKDFADLPLWQKAIQGIVASPKSLLGSDPTFECSSLGEFSGSDQLTLRFCCDPTHYFLPLISEFWKGNTRISRSTITKLGSFKGLKNSLFFFPTETSTVWFNTSGPSVGNAEFEKDFELSSLQLNEKYTVDDFTIDPGTANRIIDIDKHVIIQVPN